MEVEKIDHVHVKTNNLESAVSNYEGLIGRKFLFEADFSDLYGMKVAFNSFPLGFELMEATDKGKEMGRMYAEAPDGVFAISLKVPDIEKATVEMESMGYKLILRYDFGPIKEALFDTKKALMIYIELMEYPGESVESMLGEALPPEMNG